MECFLCEKTMLEIMLLKCPVETVYDNVWIEIVGNAQPNEYICLGCVGEQIDIIEDDLKNEPTAILRYDNSCNISRN